ncbi:amino acid ABC transporter substrate-binding protein, PAAT family [Limimonas halophila]|uniref:Amino acid ABC transporter substrate-binding protein, PAAT family n=1 Tax=Limimonas halophila TaxID=1082479 RepID=A0A1G7L608_9PROT|nr:transporter substrate-binding domain-containing protein [Limimonas halophila]SDF44883.1 amino acid ABC transporter substrate-binding protein, PAAT family [Limimonas halophila]
MRTRTGLMVALTLALSASAAQAETWTVTSLGWQPFSGADLKKQGAGIHALRTALDTVGVDLKVKFMPWKRAKGVARNNPNVVGYYPSWPSEVVDGFFASQTVFKSPVGFAETESRPIDWQKPSDLADHRVGTVGAYIYPESFQKLVDSGDISTVEARDDATALRMLKDDRVDTVAIDKYVMRYHLNTNPALKGFGDQVSFDDKALVNYDLVLAFADNAENRERAKTLKKALGNVDTQQIIADYLQGLK